MYLSKLIEKTQLDPKTILEILDECNPEAEKPDLHQFIGIINQDSKKKEQIIVQQYLSFNYYFIAIW